MKPRHHGRLFVVLLVVALLVDVRAAMAQGGATDRAKPVVIDTIRFDPPTFAPGVPVTVQLSVQPLAATWTEVTLTSGFADPGRFGPQILSATTTRRGGIGRDAASPLITVRFVAWKPGPGALPALTLGGLSIPPLRFECQSSLAAGDRRSPEPLPQLDPPGLYRQLYMLGGAVILVTLGVILFATRMVPWLRALADRWAYAQARREFDTMLERLEHESGSAEDWAVFCAGLRRFAGSRARLDLSALTASELAALGSDAIPGGVGAEASALVSIGDEVRFAGRSGPHLASATARARSLADALDQATDPRRKNIQPNEHGGAA